MFMKLSKWAHLENPVYLKKKKKENRKQGVRFANAH